MKKILILAIAQLLLVGCQTSKVISLDGNSPMPVVLGSEIKLPDTVFYYGPGGEDNLGEQILGPLGGLMGELTGGGINGGSEALGIYFEKTGIDVSDIFVNKLKESLKESSKFTLKGESDSEDEFAGKLALEIQQYGFIQTHGFSKIYYPIVTVRIRLFDSSGNQLQNRHGSAVVKDAVIKNEMPYFTQDPEIMREALEVSFDIAVKDALRKF